MSEDDVDGVPDVKMSMSAAKCSRHAVGQDRVPRRVPEEVNCHKHHSRHVEPPAVHEAGCRERDGDHDGVAGQDERSGPWVRHQPYARVGDEPWEPPVEMGARDHEGEDTGYGLQTAVSLGHDGSHSR